MGGDMRQFQLDLPDSYNVSEILFNNLEAGRGDKVAIYCGDEKLSYGELAEMASSVGRGLQDLGLEPGARVLMLLLDAPAFPATFFGSIRAGYLPIPANTVLQPDDYSYFLQDSAAQAVVVDGSLYPQIEKITSNCPALKHIIVVEGEGAAGTLDWATWLASANTDLDPAQTNKDDPAFLLYSSGSTGFPKGVIHLQHDIPYTVETYAKQVLRIKEEDITFSASKAFHAYGLGNNVTFPYSVGASTVLFPGRPTPQAAFEHVERYHPTLFFAVPTLYAAMLATDVGNNMDFKTVRYCVSAAEALPPEVYRQWHARFNLEILDGIGSTEMLHIFMSNRPGQVKPGSSGVLVPGYDAKILDENGTSVEVGDSGDLFVKGGSAAPYYWNRPEKTKHTMRGDWLFTGDRYYQDKDGFFYYAGRSDDMLKVGGQWVSPIEVENTLLEHSAVLESAVVAARDEANLQRTKAFVVLHQGYRGSAELAKELQEFVKSRIAPYKYPRLVDFVEELPKTATGKIQRFRLRQE